MPAYSLIVVHLARMHVAGGQPVGVPLSKVFRIVSLILQAMPSQ